MIEIKQYPINHDVDHSLPKPNLLLEYNLFFLYNIVHNIYSIQTNKD